MSLRIHRADLAVTTDGAVLLNVAPFDENLGAMALVKVALVQPGEVFIGVSLSPQEVGNLIRGVGLILPNVTGPIVGRRLRSRR
jgi:hypothetical protein